MRLHNCVPRVPAPALLVSRCRSVRCSGVAVVVPSHRVPRAILVDVDVDLDPLLSSQPCLRRRRSWWCCRVVAPAPVVSRCRVVVPTPPRSHRLHPHAAVAAAPTSTLVSSPPHPPPPSRHRARLAVSMSLPPPRPRCSHRDVDSVCRRSPVPALLSSSPRRWLKSIGSSLGSSSGVANHSSVVGACQSVVCPVCCHRWIAPSCWWCVFVRRSLGVGPDSLSVSCRSRLLVGAFRLVVSDVVRVTTRKRGCRFVQFACCSSMPLALGSSTSIAPSVTVVVVPRFRLSVSSLRPSFSSRFPSRSPLITPCPPGFHPLSYL